MTNRELQAKLAQYPDDAEVSIEAEFDHPHGWDGSTRTDYPSNAAQSVGYEPAVGRCGEVRIYGYEI